MGTGSTPTLRDVARAAGVSPMTASNALHGKPGVKESTRLKVVAAAKKLDYRINLTASMLKSGRSNIIHIVVNEYDSPFYSKLVQSLSAHTTARGLTPFLEQTRYSPDAAKQALQSSPFSDQLFDGEILHASGLNPDAPIDSMTHGRPFVLIDSCEIQPTTDQVNFPNEEGARAAVRHLIDRGCQRVALVGETYMERGELAQAQSSGALRLRGASGALLDAGLPYDEPTVFHAYGIDDGIAAGERIARHILAARGTTSETANQDPRPALIDNQTATGTHVYDRGGHPQSVQIGNQTAADAGQSAAARTDRRTTANARQTTTAQNDPHTAERTNVAEETAPIPFDGVFCANDCVAFAVIRGLNDLGLDVPRDVKVIGFDGASAGAYATPSLSTIQVDLDQLSRFALDLLVRRIERRANGETDEPPAQLTIGYRLVERESTSLLSHDGGRRSHACDPSINLK
ncbi:LacI family transcriptional regulator [Bifidobacterium lemurum]|uniref:LacI family transcriptional regulator n=1 Tax=Bifidobacterium lemurum TaxID=1603886 RepID=A0A261FPQ7_9BIFI|nr:LacI family DNA-binding transcriptional regulator [Bifidobacterium lemurum]OZG60975.1 LacI family transcriptional regulator [Bifidobacterium lemurum]